MAQHGYLREYDEDRGEDREAWRDRDREPGWRGGDWMDRGRRSGEHDRNERNLGFMLGERSRRSEWERAPRNFSSRQDDHYRSWRDKQMEVLDQDYADYCREREQQFHQDFDQWRSRRHGNPQPLRTGMTQSGLSSDPSGELQLTEDEAIEPAGGPDPMATATLGTTSSGKRR